MAKNNGNGNGGNRPAPTPPTGEQQQGDAPASTESVVTQIDPANLESPPEAEAPASEPATETDENKVETTESTPEAPASEPSAPETPAVETAVPVAPVAPVVETVVQQASAPAPTPAPAPAAPANKAVFTESHLGLGDHVRAKVSRTDGANGTRTISVEEILDTLLQQPYALIEVAESHVAAILHLIETAPRTKKFATISDAARAKAVWGWKTANKI